MQQSPTRGGQRPTDPNAPGNWGGTRLCVTVGCVLPRALGWLGLAAELAGGLVPSGRQFWVMGCFDRQRREQRVDLALRDAVAAFRTADQPALQLDASKPGADGLRVYAELPGGDWHGDERLSHAFPSVLRVVIRSY